MPTTRYDSPAQQQLMQTYAPIPFQELMQAGLTKQNQYEQGAQAKDSFFKSLSDVKVAPGKDELDYQEKMAKLDSSLRDLQKNSPDMGSYEFKSSLNNLMREQNRDTWWRNAQQNRALYVKAAEQVQEEKNKGNVDYNLLPAYQYMRNFEQKGTQGLMQSGSGMFQLPGSTKYADFGERMDKILNDVKADGYDIQGYDETGNLKIRKGGEERALGKLVNAGMSRIGEFSSTLEGQNFVNKLSSQLGRTPTQDEYRQAYAGMVQSVAEGKVYHKTNNSVDFDKAHGDWLAESNPKVYQFIDHLSTNEEAETKASELSKIQKATPGVKIDKTTITPGGAFGASVTFQPRTETKEEQDKTKQQTLQKLEQQFPKLLTIYGKNQEETDKLRFNAAIDYYKAKAKNIPTSTFSFGNDVAMKNVAGLLKNNVTNSEMSAEGIQGTKDFSSTNNIAAKLGYKESNDFLGAINGSLDSGRVKVNFDKGQFEVQVPYKGSDKIGRINMKGDEVGNYIMEQGKKLKKAALDDNTYVAPQGKVTLETLSHNPTAVKQPDKTVYIVVGSPSMENPGSGKAVVKYTPQKDGMYIPVQQEDVNNTLQQLTVDLEDHYKNKSKNNEYKR